MYIWVNVSCTHTHYIHAINTQSHIPFISKTKKRITRIVKRCSIKQNNNNKKNIFNFYLTGGNLTFSNLNEIIYWYLILTRRYVNRLFILYCVRPIGMLLKCKFELISKFIQIGNDLTVICGNISFFIVFFSFKYCWTHGLSSTML